ncbi:hypothetical protein DIPPA_29842 [Diplonema papillatum]|nr:hypothetical protein DIPPA_29842 [Diplonema papillatum]
MTEGRFESRTHTGPLPRDFNSHWATHNRHVTFPFRKFDAETRQKESCPFHDLRAQGQFQPEIYNTDDTTGLPDPNYFHRPGGGGMNTHLRTGPADSCGGGALALDTAPLPPSGKARRDRPWTGKGVDAFSSYPYQPLGPPTAAAAKPFQAGAHFHAGKPPTKAAPYEHIGPGDSGALRPPKPCRLRAGKCGGLFDGNIHSGPQMVTVPPPRVAKPLIAKPTTNLRTNLHNTFGTYPPHMPSEPHGDDMGKRKRQLKPIYTWANRTKRSMPISATWHATRVAAY